MIPTKCSEDRSQSLWMRRQCTRIFPQLDSFPVSFLQGILPTAVNAQLRSDNPGRSLAVFEQTCCYAAACLFPWIATEVTVHTDALRSTPLSLSVAAVVFFSLLINFKTGIVACFSTAAAFNHYVLSPPKAWTFTVPHLIHTAGVLAVGFLVAMLCERQHVISYRLRRALASVRTQTDALVEAQQGSNSVAWRCNIKDRCIQWADGGAEVFGRPFADICTLDTPASLLVPEDRNRFEEAFEAAFASGNGLHVDFRVQWPNGELHWLEACGEVSPTNPEIWRGVMIDITERKKAELALIRSEKLAAIGRLSATVAHEINNPLEAVTNLLFLATLDPDLQPTTRQYLAQADQELARLAGIARHTLTFARPSPATGPVNLAEVVENVAVLFQPRFKSRGGQIRLLFHTDLYLSAPPDELRQIFTNLIANACDAIHESGGLVEIELSCEGESAVIQVRDNGTGIPEKNLARIFEPFFTTKEGVGTGIGLWITRELVEKNAGRISVHTDSQPSEFRTVFRLEFPYTERLAATSVASSHSAIPTPQT